MSKTYAHERKDRYEDADELLPWDEGRERPRRDEPDERKGDRRRVKVVTRPDLSEADEIGEEPRRHRVRW